MYSRIDPTFFFLLALLSATFASASDDAPRSNLRRGMLIGNELSLCGCSGCRSDTLAGDKTCGQHIQDLIIADSTLTEADACLQTAKIDHPTACHMCGCAASASVAEFKQPPPPPPPRPALCGRDTCTQDVWKRDANGFQCGARIAYLAGRMGMEAACHVVAGKEFPGENRCGPCDPQGASTDRFVEPAANNAVANTVTVTNTLSSTGNNGQAMSSSNSALNKAPPVRTRCGCEGCTDEFLRASNAAGYTCEQRIDYLLGASRQYFPTEEDACRQVAHVEFPLSCGPCYCS